jgi:tRNA-specific 2-thiouridylase
MPKKQKNRKIAVALSGGIDSAVAAGLLCETDYFNVTGVFMRLWASEGRAKEFKSDEKRAKKIAKFLKIPFFVFDFRKEFKNKVVNCFLKEHKAGLTPNPCVICNKTIKFGKFLEKAKSLGAEFIATGHYARIREKRGVLELVKAKDREKDQSYFLWKLHQKQLRRTLFPIGGYTKKEVERLARKLGFPVSEFKKSQEVCFIGKKPDKFLRNYLGNRTGKIVNVEGRTLGHHDGLWFFTLGQRKKIMLSDGPYYVINKDLRKNLLVVSKHLNDLLTKEIIINNISWILQKEPKSSFLARVKIRYQHKPASALIKKINNKSYKIVFTRQQRAPTLGQSVVLYSRDKVLGGGIICT